MRPPMLRKLVLAHRWLGLALVVPLVAIVLAGALLLFRNTLWIPPEWRDSSLSTQRSDAALAGALHELPDWRFVDVATPGRAFQSVGLSDDQVAVFRVGAAAPEAPPLRLATEQFLFRLHTRLLVGEAGKAAVRVVGPLAVASLVVGLLIWWPRRRGWRPRDLLPSGAKRATLLRLHLSWGAAAALLLVPMVVSGALLAHNPTIRGWLKPLAPPAAGLAPDIQALQFAQRELAAAIATGRRIWRDGILTQLARTPADPRLVTMKFRLPGEKHPNGRSTIAVDLEAGRVVAMRDARSGGVPAGYDDVLYPLHIGELGGAVQAWAWFLGGCGLVVILVSGVLAWLRGWLARRASARL